jgi:hypothetical protein
VLPLLLSDAYQCQLFAFHADPCALPFAGAGADGFTLSFELVETTLVGFAGWSSSSDSCSPSVGGIGHARCEWPTAARL